MALDDHSRDAVLRCGTLLDDLILQVTEGRAALNAAHQATCEYCQQTLELVRAGWEEFLALARSTVEVPGDLAQRITHQIQSLTDPSRAGIVVTAARGETVLRHEVLRRIARAEALRVDGVALATVTVEDVDGAPARGPYLRLRLVVGYGPTLSALADAARVRVRAALAGQAGVEDVRIDVEIADILLGERIS